MNTMPIGISEAVQSLRPRAQWVLLEGTLDWHDTEQTQPTEAEINAEIVRLDAEWVSNEYARNRKEEYNALNQFELISDDSINGTTTHKDAILAIKAAHPKP